MQEVEGFVNGTFDYYELKGDTGPLVYPAGFVYVYTLLYAITGKGLNIKLAQYIFVGIYLAFITLVFVVHRKTKRVSFFISILFLYFFEAISLKTNSKLNFLGPTSWFHFNVSNFASNTLNLSP